MLDFSILITDTNRSKAYLQNLVANNFFPREAILLQDKKQTLPEQDILNKIGVQIKKQSLMRTVEGLDNVFDEKEELTVTLEKNDIPYKIIDNIDVNSKHVVNAIRNIPTEYILYSGPGGCILRDEILNQGKRFIHVHAGWLPEYRGSTTMYYSILIDNHLGCSVIILDKGIDSGRILYRKRFDTVANYIDYDLVFDPLMRTSTLIEFMKNTNGKIELEEGELQVVDGDPFYIIHPVLKHLSILKLKKDQEVKDSAELIGSKSKALSSLK